MSESEMNASISWAIALSAENEMPDSIQWMPPGERYVMPTVDGKPKRMKMQVTSALAEKFNTQLQKIRTMAAAGEADEPYIDFNHEDRERAGEVTELYWGGDDQKTGGIRARIKWSAAGREAVLGRNYRRFSPSWHPDRYTNEPLCIGTNLGGLVNRAAFTTIAPIIAKNESAATSTKKPNMEIKDIEEALDKRFKPITDRLAALETRPAQATAAAANATGNSAAELSTVLQTAIASAIKPFADQLKEHKENTTRAMAHAAIQPHVQRGAIAPQDKDTVKFWEDTWINSPAIAEAQMAKLPGTKTGRVIATTRENGTSAAAAAAGVGEPEDKIMARADELMKANSKLNPADAVIAAAKMDQDAYMDFRKKFTTPAGSKN